MLTFELSLEADKDLENIFGYGIEHFGLESALIFYDALNDVFNRICNNPEHFQPVDDIKTGYRRAVFNTYSIFFIERWIYRNLKNSKEGWSETCL
ncbi:MAG: type II toxin-antitoxin system RelE/ParE family toxin [Glaciecola sp.]|jgi:toxin ParE1/3/4